MSKESKGKFKIFAGNKGGIGKSTIARQIGTAILHKEFGKKVKLIEVDDNNVTDTFTSTIFNSESFKVDSGIDETLKSIFEVFNNENIVIDVGGGNDSNHFLDSILAMGLDDNCDFFIPVLKNKSGMKNLLDTYHRIRSKSTSKIIIILNQTKSSDSELVKAEFTYFFGSKELNIKGAYDEIFNDDNLVITSLTDTNVYDISEDYGLTAYEIALEDLNVKEFLKEKQALGYDEFLKALSFTKAFNLCRKNYEESFIKFYEEVQL